MGEQGPPDDSRTIQVRVAPRSRRESVEPQDAGRVIVRTSAAPVDGAANERVVELLAEHYGVRRRQVEILKGHRSRDKVVRITGART
jgi:uncharacterized protein (TIGR00251 family)